MKKILLLLGAFPCLLSAQTSKDGINKASALWFNRLQTKNDMALRSESIDNLPDSTYTYYDGRLHKAVSIKYNEDGWPVLEKGYTDFALTGSPNDDVKREYTYTHEGDFLVQEAVVYIMPYRDGVWHKFSKTISYINANNLAVKEILYYPHESSTWELNEVFASVEYNEKGNPTVAVDSIPGVGGQLKAIMRFEIFYDSQDRISGFNTFAPHGGTGEWIPEERISITYDERGNRLDTHFIQDKSGEWKTVSYLIETLYDERGNIISETEKTPGEDGEYHIRWSDTYRHVYLPDVITSAPGIESGNSSVIYPSPADSYVTVSLQEAENALVTLVDISGKVVARQAIGRQAIIPVNYLSRGIYLLTVKTEKGTDVHKLIVK
ncbi:MAG: T9SS type A sorting domain-containing protein [Tannerella sp.]|nr:T9SS type A sorting domain-containing protein [Tannerella sp.]